MSEESAQVEEHEKIKANEVRFGEKVMYLEGTMRHEVVLKTGDRIQVWFNDRQRPGKSDPVVQVKVLPLGKQKGVDLSDPISGCWARLKRDSQEQQ